MNQSISLGGRISRAIAVTVLSFFLMIWLFHFMTWVKFPDFWGGVALLVDRYMAGDLGHRFFMIWVKAVIISSTKWKGAFEISSSFEISFFIAWLVDRWFLKYHSRFLRDAPKI
jgi:type II restriction/modification system DNA methylase subunit YeeA